LVSVVEMEGKGKRKLPSWLLTNKENSESLLTGKVNHSKQSEVPKLVFQGKTVYCHMKDECNFICEELNAISKKRQLVLGFDIEWRAFTSGERRKTSILQLCVSNKKCYVFQLSVMPKFPSELQLLLENEAILKVGVGIDGDINRLVLEGAIKTPKSCIDISKVANEKFGNFERWSLNGLLMNQHQRMLSKDQKVRCSNWDNYPLTEEQLDYAVLDAYAALLIYMKLEQK